VLPLRIDRAALKAIAAIAAAAFAVASPAAQDYAKREEVRAFVARMAEKHGFRRDALLRLFHRARFEPAVIQAISPPREPGIRSWSAYRLRYLDAPRIGGGLSFWQRNADALDEAQARFDVPPEIIVAIIGIETLYGRMTGGYQTLSALATLAFDYPPRAELFRGELEELLLLGREQHRDAAEFRGSYAGALGLPQFLPSSYRRYAIDFDGDGAVDLDASAADAIGSVAYFLQQHGWRSGGRIAVPALVPEQARALADGEVRPKYSPEELAQHGITPGDGSGEDENAAVVDLVSVDAPTEYWLGFENFYVLTRYNRSSFYAMAVFQLAETLREARAALQAQD
jgi:membrane-bound lytic murein transglycosylase B